MNNKLILEINNHTDSELKNIVKQYIIDNYDINLIKDDISKLKFPKTYELINTFNDLNSTKIRILDMINKWYLIYNKKKFINLSIDNKIEYLESLQKRLNSIFDIDFKIKLLGILEYGDKYLVVENVKERLLLTYKLFGYNIFKTLNIPIILSYEIDDMENIKILGYIVNIHKEIDLLLKNTIALFKINKILIIKINLIILLILLVIVLYYYFHYNIS